MQNIGDKILKIYLVLSFVILALMGCATTAQYAVAPTLPLATGGIYHKVMTGETLWRISQLYNIDLDSLVSVNRIPDAAKIEKGQMIFIPGVTLTRSTAMERSYSSDTNFIWPLEGKIVSYFGERFKGRLNKGINIQARNKKDVRASRSGRVSFADFLKGYGNTLIIDHGDGLSTVYCVNSQIFVKPKDAVTQGTVIGKCDTGSSADAPSLHFEIRRGSKSQNPLYYLP